MTRTARRRAFRPAITLIELIASITIIAIAGAAVLPVMESAASGYADAVATRTAAERAAYAIERATLLLREAPAADEPGDVGIATAEPDRITLSNGSALTFENGALSLTMNGVTAELCAGVAEFELTYTGADGLTDTAATPEATRRIGISIAVSGVGASESILRLRTVVFPRACLGGGS